MEFKNGTSVVTADGKSAGNLHRVVLNPETNEVTHIVTQKGLLTTEDKVIPIEKVESASFEKITLFCTSDDLKMMSPLEVSQLTPENETETIDRIGGGMYTTTPPLHAEPREIVRTIPEDLVALKEGAHVISADEKHVGNIEKVFVESGKITHFITTQGLLLKTMKAIPIEWVEMVNDNEVKLTVAADQLVDMRKDQ